MAEDGLPGTEVTTSVVNDDSRENMVDSMGDIGGSNDHDDDSNLPSLEDILSQAGAMAPTTIPHSDRQMGHNVISESGRFVGNRTDMQGRGPNIGNRAGSGLGSSQDCPIVLDDLDDDNNGKGRPDTELGVAAYHVKCKQSNGMERSRAPSPTDDCPSPDGNTAVTNPASPPAEAPAAAGRIHDIFAEYKIKFGSDSSTRKSGQRKGSSLPFLHGAKPGCDESLALNAKARDRLLLSTNRKVLTVPSLHSPGMMVLMPAMPPTLKATAMTAADSRMRHP